MSLLSSAFIIVLPAISPASMALLIPRSDRVAIPALSPRTGHFRSRDFHEAHQWAGRSDIFGLSSIKAV